MLRKAADAKEVPGLLAVAATGNAIIYPGAFGKRDLSKDAAMTFRQPVQDRLEQDGLGRPDTDQ